MLPVSDWEIEQIRADIEGLLPETVHRLTETRTGDGQGGWTSTWGTAATTTGRLDAVSGNEQLTGGAVQSYHRYWLTLPAATTALTTDRWKVGGATYSTVSVGAGSWQGCRRVLVEAV